MSFYLRYRNQSRKVVFCFALCLATSMTCFAKPREVLVTDDYDGVAYHFAEKIAKAVSRDKKSNLFRMIVTQSGPSSWSFVSALYNRKHKTLKTHYYSDWLMPDDDRTPYIQQLARRSHSTVGWLYRNVTDAKLRRLATMKNESYLFGDGDSDGKDKDLIKLKIRSRRIYNRTTFWDIQPSGKETRPSWIYDENTLTYRYPKKKSGTK